MPTDQNKIPGAQATQRITALYGRVSAAIRNELINLRNKDELTRRDMTRFSAWVERVLGVAEVKALALLEDGVAASVKAGSLGFGAPSRAAEARQIVADNLDATLAEIQAQSIAKGSEYIRAANLSIGRQTDDIVRRIGLEKVKEALDENLTGGQTARSITEELIDAPAKGPLVDIEGERFFVDKRGRKWKPKYYARMVARTTTREAMSQAFIETARAQSSDLVRVSSHPDGKVDPICVPYDGKLFSLSGRTPGVPVLERTPPFHPNCRHVLIPPTLDDLEQYGA